MIPNRVVRQGEYIIDTSGIVDRLINGYRTTTRGRPPSHDKLRLMLLALYLTAHQRRTLMLKTAFNTLTNDIDLKTKIRLGVCDPVRHRRLLVSCFDFYNFARAIKTGLAWIDTPDSRIPPNDHTRRRQVVEDCCDAVMDVFPTRWEESATVAIDATGIHAWGRSMPKKTIDVLDEMDLSGTDIKDKQKRFERRLAKRYEHEPDQAPPVKARREWEARYGNKTDKNGREAVFFGYHEHTVVIVPPAEIASDAVPPLIQRFRLTPANADVVDPTLNMLDSININSAVNNVLVDRHYHYKQWDRWGAELRKRRIGQHLDLRSDETGFILHDGMPWAAGQAHCPATPDELGRLQRPAVNAPRHEFDRFRTQIAARKARAMVPRTKLDEHGRQRLQCPALAGLVGCPLREGSKEVAIRAGLPIVQEPPSLETHPELPKCCTQETVKPPTPPEPILKLQQLFYWGSREWEEHYARRTYVEGSYGIRKNPAAENVDRGQNQVFGLVWLHLTHALVNASYNLNRLEAWAAKHPDHPHAQHPLLAIPDTEQDHFGVYVTAEEFRQLQQNRDAA